MPRQQLRQRPQEAEQAYEHSDTDVSFRHGVMHVSGHPQRPERVDEFASSNGYSKYTTVVWVDPITGVRRTSCNCPGWAIKRGAQRQCKHTKAIESGYTGGLTPAASTPIVTAADAARHVPNVVPSSPGFRQLVFRDP